MGSFKSIKLIIYSGIEFNFNISLGDNHDNTSTSKHWDNFDPRITAINIYRSSNPEGPYYFLYDISTLRDDPNLIHGRTGHIGSGVHFEGANYIDSGLSNGQDITNWKLCHYVNMSTISAGYSQISSMHNAQYNIAGVSGDIAYLNKSINYINPNVASGTGKIADNIWRNYGGNITIGDNNKSLSDYDMRKIYSSFNVNNMDQSYADDLQMGAHIKIGPNLIETDWEALGNSLTNKTNNWAWGTAGGGLGAGSPDINFNSDPINNDANYPVAYNVSKSVDNIYDTDYDVSGNNKMIHFESTNGGTCHFFYVLKDTVVSGGTNQNANVLEENTDYVLSMWVLGAKTSTDYWHGIQVGIGNNLDSTPVINDYIINWDNPDTDNQSLFYHRTADSSNSFVSGCHLQLHFNSGPKSGWEDIHTDFTNSASGVKGLYLVIKTTADASTANSDLALADIEINKTVQGTTGFRYSGGERVVVDPLYNLPLSSLENNAMIIGQYLDDSSRHIPNLYGEVFETYVLDNTQRAILFDSFSYNSNEVPGLTYRDDDGPADFTVNAEGFSLERVRDQNGLTFF